MIAGAYIDDRSGEGGIAQEGVGVLSATEVDVNEEIRGPVEIRRKMG